MPSLKIQSNYNAWETSVASTQKNNKSENGKGISDDEKFTLLSQQDQLTISSLMGETDELRDRLKTIVSDLLQRQGKSLENLKPGEKVTVDDIAKAEAEQMIAEDGPLGVEKTSERIFQFAKAISGGDQSKLQVLKDAIEEGYKAAEKYFGGELPEISQKTIERVYEKLDDWTKDGNTVVE